jgi:hypothetical protein
MEIQSCDTSAGIEVGLFCIAFVWAMSAVALVSEWSVPGQQRYVIQASRSRRLHIIVPTSSKARDTQLSVLIMAGMSVEDGRIDGAAPGTRFDLIGRSGYFQISGHEDVSHNSAT